MNNGSHVNLYLLQEVQSSDTFWEWLSGDIIPAAYSGKWYNGQKEEIPEFLDNKKLIMLGMPRLRQLRVKSGESIKTISDNPRSSSLTFKSILFFICPSHVDYLQL